MAMYPRREGLYEMKVNQAVEVKVGQVGINKFNKKQVSGFVNNTYYFLPTHQELVDKLIRVPEGETVTVKRLTQGSKTETAKYEVSGIESESPEVSPDHDKVLKMILESLQNNVPSQMIIQILEKELGKDTVQGVLNDLGL